MHRTYRFFPGLSINVNRSPSLNLFGAKRDLECGDKSRAVRGSRHRFSSALCAEHGGVKRRPDEQTLVPPKNS